MPEPTPQEQETRRQWQRQQQLARSSAITQLPTTVGQAAAAQNEEENIEEQWGRDLTRQRIQRLQQKAGFKETYNGLVSRLSNPELDLEDNEDLQTLKKMQKAITSKSMVQAAKAGVQIGYELRQRIAAGSFRGFLMALSLAIIKDLVDLATLGWVGALINIIVTLALLVIIMFQGIWFKRFIIKKMWKRWIGAMAGEFIPFLNMIPWWTISVLLVKREADKKRKQHQRALEQLEVDLKQLQTAK